jgi:ATP-binding cassette, subfamily B, beta-glucan exporter
MGGFLHIYGRVIGLLTPERGLVIVLTVANLALAALQFAEPMLFGRVIDLLAGSASRPAGDVWTDAVVLLGIWAAVGLGNIAAGILVALHADRMAHRNRLSAMARYFEHVMELPLAYHRGTHSGRLLKVMMTGASHLFALWLAFFREHLSTFVAFIVLLPMTLFINWRLASLLLVLMVVFAVLTLLVVQHTYAAQDEVEERHSELAARASDALGNVLLVQSFVRLAIEAGELRDVMRRLLAAQFPVLNWWALVTVLSRAASTITVIAIFVLGTWLHLRGQASVGEIVSFMGFATLLIGRMEQAMGFVNQTFAQAPALGEFFEVLDTSSPLADKPGARTLERVEGRVRFDNVTFAYGDRTAVNEFTLDVAPGTVVALVGPTGAGKSTAVGLLYRLWDPQNGAIVIDGYDLRDVTLSSLRQHIGVVFQDSAMFFRSIADNLRVGKSDATDAELEAAARLAEAHEFIEAQPEGYNTMIGERGATLSGGERQRLAIARALLKNPPILILDEATSALDALTEAKVQRALGVLMKGRTTFIIAHRLSTIRNADLILLMDHGRIIERGTFDTLIAQGGRFAELFKTQFGEAAPSTSA